jgi:hypothetical protein
MILPQALQRTSWLPTGTLLSSLGFLPDPSSDSVVLQIPLSMIEPSTATVTWVLGTARWRSAYFLVGISG